MIEAWKNTDIKDVNTSVDRVKLKLSRKIGNGVKFASVKRDSGFNEDNYLVVEADSTGGMSGGPIFNSRGELLAVHGRGHSPLLPISVNKIVTEK